MAVVDGLERGLGAATDELDEPVVGGEARAAWRGSVDPDVWAAARPRLPSFSHYRPIGAKAGAISRPPGLKRAGSVPVGWCRCTRSTSNAPARGRRVRPMDARRRGRSASRTRAGGSRTASTATGPRVTVLLHGLLLSQRMHVRARARARGARGPCRHARPLRPRALGPAAGHVALRHGLVRPRRGRAARPPRARRGRRRRHVAGREHHARGGVGGAGAAARDGARDARARQRAARLRGRLHAADGRADRRRAADERTRSASRG